jgi:Catalase
MIDTTLCPKVQHLFALENLCFQLTLTGCPFANDKTAILMRGRQGGGLALLQDTQLIETLAHFSRERIPERLVDFPTDPSVPGFTVY